MVVANACISGSNACNCRHRRTEVPSQHECESAIYRLKKRKTLRVQIKNMLEMKTFALKYALPELLTYKEDVPRQMQMVGALVVHEDPTYSLTLVEGALEGLGATLTVPVDAGAFDVHGQCFTGPVQISWMFQLLQRPRQFAIHIDGKHKLHHAGFILITLGTHYLVWDVRKSELRTRFAPLVYLFCKEHETDGSALLIVKAFKYVCMKYFGAHPEPGASVSDHCDAYRKAMVDELLPALARHGSCYPHIMRKWNEGHDYMKKTWRYHEEVKQHIRYINLAHNESMKVELIHAIGKVWEKEYKLPDGLRKFWNSNMTGEWDQWSIGEFGCMLFTPHNQAQESWHKQILRSKIPGMFKGSTEGVFSTALPKLIRVDGLMMPNVLTFDVPAIPRSMVEKAKWLVDHKKTHIVEEEDDEHDDDSVAHTKYFVLRKDNPGGFKKISDRMVDFYEDCSRGATRTCTNACISYTNVYIKVLMCALVQRIQHAH